MITPHSTASEHESSSRHRLARMRADGVTAAVALALFDSLPPVLPYEMIGQWRGDGIPTGHPLDGLLEAYGWYGKAFYDEDRVDPLLFDTARGPVPLDPRWLPLGALRFWAIRSGIARLAFRVARPLFSTRRPAARLRVIDWNGQATAAMIYDRLPIVDMFKRVSPDLLLGLMDARGYPPFFFSLERCIASAVNG